MDFVTDEQSAVENDNQKAPEEMRVYELAEHVAGTTRKKAGTGELKRSVLVVWM